MGKILSLFPSHHFSVCRKNSVHFELILEIFYQYVSLALSDKISDDASRHALSSWMRSNQYTASSLTATDPRSLVVTGEEHFEDGRIASREILPTGKILTPFPCPHFCVCRKACVRFEQILETPVGIDLLSSRVRSLMKQVGMPYPHLWEAR